MKRFKTVYTGGTAEITEKKSRFIGTVMPVSTQEDALAFLDQIRKQNWSASHNCSAYIINGNPSLERCSDDGEPAHTAGRPMLDVLLGEGLTDLAVVVTRYFGGTLLGTGGLVRAYQGTVKEALKKCCILEKCPGKVVELKTDYSNIGKLQYITGLMQIPILETTYTDIVNVQLLLTQETEGLFYKKIQEATAGTSHPSVLSEVYFAALEEKILLYSR